MATTKGDIITEAVKVSFIAWLLFYITDDAQYEDTLWESALFLLKAAFVAAAYLAGREFGEYFEAGWRNYVAIFLVSGLIAICAWGALGTHVEDSDPMFGGGERVQDYEPSDEQRDNHALFSFLVIFIPATYGAFKRRNPSF